MSGLAGQALGLDTQSPTPIGGTAAVDVESKGSMENFIGFGLGATSYDPAPVDFDAADDTVTSASDGSTRVAPEYTDNQLTWGGSTPADGILFDTARGDSFVGNFVASPTNGAVIAADTITMNSDTPVNVLVMLQRMGVLFEQCFDTIEVLVDFNLTGPFGGASIPGITLGFLDDVFGWYAIISQGHGGLGGNAVLPSSFIASGIASNGTDYALINTGIPCTDTINFSASMFDVRSVDNGVNTLTDSFQLVFTAGSRELPRSFSGIGMLFEGGHVVITGIKITAAYPNAKYVLIGDSITQGRFASTYPEGWGAVFRSTYPDDTIICGAPGVYINEWSTANISVVADMKPKYAIVMLGTNNTDTQSDPAVMMAEYDVVMANIESHGILPIAIGIPPCGRAVVPQFNALMQAAYPRYINCYTPLLGTGNSMAPAYDSGDGIHPNSAGHLVIADTIKAAITANGWN
jgi:lysophospholipase L1-like esterase